MAEKDISEKNLEAWNDVFADIVNVLLFKGKRLIKEQDLEADTKDSMLKANNELHEQERDVSKFWKNGEIRISILGIENQTNQDYKMPLRVISYDGASYKQQLMDEKVEHYYPVCTLVLYFGTKTKWTAPKTLHKCFSIPDELEPFVSDYKINVFNIAWLDDETINMFNSDFKFVAKYFQTKRKNTKYIPTNEQITHVDSIFKTFKALTGDKRFEEIYNKTNLKNKRGGVTMDEFLDKIINEGMEKGIEKGRAKEKADLIRKMLDKKYTTEQIADLFDISVKEVKKIAAKVPVEA